MNICSTFNKQGDHCANDKGVKEHLIAERAAFFMLCGTHRKHDQNLEFHLPPTRTYNPTPQAVVGDTTIDVNTHKETTQMKLDEITAHERQQAELVAKKVRDDMLKAIADNAGPLTRKFMGLEEPVAEWKAPIYVFKAYKIIRRNTETITCFYPQDIRSTLGSLHGKAMNTMKANPALLGILFKLGKASFVITPQGKTVMVFSDKYTKPNLVRFSNRTR